MFEESMASSNQIRRIKAVKVVDPITDRNNTVDPIQGQVGTQTPSNQIKKRSKRSALTYNRVSEKFIMPIKAATKELGVSKSTLKFRCRELGIPDWPYMKMKCLTTLEASASVFAHEGYQSVIRHIREEMDAIKQNPSLEISDETNVLRNQMYDLKKKRGRGIK
ncbi:hypothetical protein LUZ61_006478 [Rhynchospora tenuis]|uniref:RWP-RK domain-containing protein n=1 Tax=Rhynchospora tenuis TaxID=198213 RepID=A0AAD5ZRP9_9POAL|nr:hypothetical protein LUZ61_006478 [Rhynchospora tenuis]